MAAKIDACTAIIDRHKLTEIDTIGQVDARRFRADAYIKSGQLDKALADLDEIQKSYPFNGDQGFWRLRLELHKAKGDVKQQIVMSPIALRIFGVNFSDAA